MTPAREYDLLIWGANGFTGRLAAEYAIKNYHAKSVVRVALGGRNEAKLAQTRANIAKALNIDASSVDVLVGGDEATMRASVGKARVVLSFAGPFDSESGYALARSCADAATDYVDITGEPQFVKRVVESEHEKAKVRGCALVSCAGYDSVPWDLGTYLAAKAVRDSAVGATVTEAHAHAGKSRGGVSGGTIASAANILQKPKSETRGMGDPHFFAKSEWAKKPEVEAARRWPSPQSGVKYDEDTKMWTMPSIMAGINSKVVARSYSLCPERYGPKFRYDESDLCKSRKSANLGALALGLFGVCFVTPPLRWMMRKTILPAQGQGPNEDTLNNGYSHVYVVAKGEASGKPLEPQCAEFEFKNADPGYRGTAALACETALCLAIASERERLPWTKQAGGGGCMTPSVCMGDVLVERLNKADNFSVTVKPLKDTVFLV
jgi:short subunit dehydrogenase-like uncharacterized protein